MHNLIEWTLSDFLNHFKFVKFDKRKGEVEPGEFLLC